MSNTHKNKEISKEERKKRSEAWKGKNNPMKRPEVVAKHSGKNNNRYNPNLTDKDRYNNRAYPDYIEWREAVYEKDNYKCQCCGDKKGGNLNAHHIESYRDNPELQTTIQNGIALCKKCHVNFHHQYGYGNNTKEHLEEYLKNNSCFKQRETLKSV